MSIRTDFNEKIRQDIQKKMGAKSIFAVPTIQKVVLNMGVGKTRENKNFLDEAVKDLLTISGQKPSARKAKTSISNFKIRKGQLVGYAVTLRGDRMWDFYEKLVKIVLPRVKDFQGLTRKSLDGSGNFSIGFTEQAPFAEIDANKIAYNKPLQVTINTSARNNEDCYTLLNALGMPFKD